MLKLHAFLNRKPSSLLPPPCQVEAVVLMECQSMTEWIKRTEDEKSTMGMVSC